MNISSQFLNEPNSSFNRTSRISGRYLIFNHLLINTLFQIENIRIGLFQSFFQQKDLFFSVIEIPLSMHVAFNLTVVPTRVLMLILVESCAEFFLVTDG
jgi:hypothetical protein